MQISLIHKASTAKFQFKYLRLPPTTPRKLCISYEFDLFTVRTYSMACHTAARTLSSSPKRLIHRYPYQHLTYAIKTRLRAACGLPDLYAPVGQPPYSAYVTA